MRTKVFNPPSFNLQKLIARQEYALPFHPKAARDGVQVEDWNKKVVGKVYHEQYGGRADCLRTLWFVAEDGRTYVAKSMMVSGIETIFDFTLSNNQFTRKPTFFGAKVISTDIKDVPRRGAKPRHRTRSRELVRDEIDIKQQADQRPTWRDERKICGRCDRPLMAKMAKDLQPTEEDGTAYLCKCGARQLKDKDGVSKLMLGIGKDGKPAFREVVIS